MSSILGKHAPAVAWLRLSPPGKTALDYLRGQVKVDGSFNSINRDRIAVFHDCQRTSFESLRRDVPDDETVRPARKTSIRYQRNILAKSAPHNGARGRKHLPHSGTATRPFISNYDYGSGFDFTRKNGFQGFFF